MDLANKRKLAINAALVGFMVALAEEADEEQHGETRKRTRKCWVNPYLQQRNGKGKYADFENLTKNPSHFFANFHMSFDSFQRLFLKLERHLIPKRFVRGGDFIRAEQKFAAVLEYLALGEVQLVVSSSYRISKQYFGSLVPYVCQVIAQELHWEIPQWEKYAVLGNALDCEKSWKLPNCVGAIGGRLVEVRTPTIRRQKKITDSIPIFAICDSSLRFTYLDVGEIGDANDPNLLAKSDLGKAILSGNLYFPEDSSINGTPMSYYVVAGDDAFPLIKRIMKPYGSKCMARDERLFNDRLQKASNCSDKAFGILSARWKVMTRLINCRPDRAKPIATACCLLHNYLRRTSPEEYADWSQEDDQAMIPINADNGPAPTEDYAKFVRDSIKNSLIDQEKKSVPSPSQVGVKR